MMILEGNWSSRTYVKPQAPQPCNSQPYTWYACLLQSLMKPAFLRRPSPILGIVCAAPCATYALVRAVVSVLLLGYAVLLVEVGLRYTRRLPP